ncbi:MAG: hypothetical protein H7Z21_19580, partial [Hymenobacter sp.]|nr:hypothetical protein [Hymenobacter sp.]
MKRPCYARPSRFLVGQLAAGLLVVLAACPARAQTLPYPVPGLPYWEWQSPRPTGLGLNDFHAFNDSTVLAVGDHGTAVRTGNGGRTWQVLPTGVDRPITSVSFANDLVGWAGTETEPTTARHYKSGAGRLLRTTDGGQTWVAQGMGEPVLSVLNPQVVAVSPTEAYVTYHLTGLELPPNTTFIIAPAPRMRHTVDGGQSWQLVTLPIGGSFDTSGEVDRPLFLSPTTGLVIAGFGTYQLLRTTDSGQNWQNVAPGTPGTFRPRLFTFLTPQRGWLAGIDLASGSDVLYQTADGGLTWSPLASLSFLPYPYIRNLTFADPLRGLFSLGGQYYATFDGGQTWSPAPTISQAFTYSQQQTRLRPGGSGWAVGGYGSLYHTADYGESWQSRASLPPILRYQALGFPDPTHGWAVAQFADGQNATTVLRTRHRGAPWQPLSLEGAVPGLSWQAGGGALHAGAFPDRDTVWVAGQEYNASLTQVIGLVLRTTNGGQSWARQSLGGASSVVTEIGSWDTRRAVAVGQYPKALFMTRNGGANWTTVPNPAPRRQPLRVTWADSATVYVTTDSAVFFKSTTAGRT